MKRVTSIGGIFFKSKNVPALKEWYKNHLGFRTTEWGASFIWNEMDPSIKALGRTEWSAFKDESDYFKPSTEPFMINYRVHDLNKLMDTLGSEGVEVAGGIDDTDYGKFAWILDNEGRKIELWEPPAEDGGEAPPAWTDRVTGLGGVFFQSNDPQASKEWYKKARIDVLRKHRQTLLVSLPREGPSRFIGKIKEGRSQDIRPLRDISPRKICMGV
jgi:predicted enzyme related to lactoylglutathione lyase